MYVRPCVMGGRFVGRRSRVTCASGVLCGRSTARAISSAPAAVSAAADALRQANAILVTAGAGIGVDSGLPDFRGNEGFWRAYPPLAKRGIQFHEMANPDWFDSEPLLAWGFYGHRYALYQQTRPHSGFAVLRALIESKTAAHGGPERSGDDTDSAGVHQARGFVFTSNVDGQFQRAGFANSRVVECHGSLNHLQCCHPRHCVTWDPSGIFHASALGLDVRVDADTFLAHEETVPSCPNGCVSIARPNVLMFGDGTWLSARTAAQQTRFHAWMTGLAAADDDEKHAGEAARLVVLDIGSGTAVPTCRMTAEQTARRFGGQLIRINPREPEMPHSFAAPERRTGGTHGGADGAEFLWSWGKRDKCRGVGLAMGCQEALEAIAAELDMPTGA